MPAKLMRVAVRRRRTPDAPHSHDTAVPLSDEALARGLSPTPRHDLKFRGGHTIPHLNYLNVYVGGPEAWAASDMDDIDRALSKAMSDERLNNVMRQYFANEPITSTFVRREFTGTQPPVKVTEAAAHKLVKALFTAGQLHGLDFPTTVVNLALPSGTLLTLGGAAEHDEHETKGHQRRPKTPGMPHAEEDSSLSGLGGYHGHATVPGRRIY